MSPLTQLASAFSLIAPLSSLPAPSTHLETQQLNQGWNDYLGDETSAFHELPLTWERDNGIPNWIKGSYIKNGPARRQFGTDERQFSSYLDGWGKLHRFSFNEGKVSFTGRMIETANYNKSVEAGKMVPTITLAHTLPKDWNMMQTMEGAINGFDNTNVMLWKLGPEDKSNGQVASDCLVIHFQSLNICFCSIWQLQTIPKSTKSTQTRLQ